MKGFEPGFLDRLFDDDPRSSTENMFKRFSLEQYKESVARDLEALLNTRSVVDETALHNLPECRRSLVTYGLRDFSALSLASSHDRACICESLKQSISRHEFRLRDVEVELRLDDRRVGGLHFLIRATLRIHPATEPVSFDAMLQPSTLQYSVDHAAASAH